MTIVAEQNSANPFCGCTDYYGEATPEYKFYNQNKGTHSCCSKLNSFAMFESKNKNSITKVKDYILESQRGSGCENFISHASIVDDEDLKQRLPMLYWQGLLNSSLFNKDVFPEVPISGSNTVYCPDVNNIPVFVSHESYTSKFGDSKLVCVNKDLEDIKDIKFMGTEYTVPYKLNYMKSADGKDCKSNKCHTLYSMNNNMEYNIGGTIYKSDGSLFQKTRYYNLHFL